MSETWGSDPELEPRPWGKASGPRAGFWRRFAALFIDGIVLGVLLVILELAIKGVGVLLWFLIYLVYFAYFEGSISGATPGKRAMGIRVIDAQTGEPIGIGRGFLRQIGRIISGLFIYLGYLWMLWDDEKQCWHDKMANDHVVNVSDYPAPSR